MLWRVNEVLHAVVLESEGARCSTVGQDFGPLGQGEADANQLSGPPSA